MPKKTQRGRHLVLTTDAILEAHRAYESMHTLQPLGRKELIVGTIAALSQSEESLLGVEALATLIYKLNRLDQVPASDWDGLAPSLQRVAAGVSRKSLCGLLARLHAQEENERKDIHDVEAEFATWQLSQDKFSTYYTILGLVFAGTTFLYTTNAPGAQNEIDNVYKLTNWFLFVGLNASLFGIGCVTFESLAVMYTSNAVLLSTNGKLSHTIVQGVLVLSTFCALVAIWVLQLNT
jgi:hypothetical protein